MTLDIIIKRDPTLDMFINGNIDWFNDHQIELRFAALSIALAYYVDWQIKTNF